MYSGCMSMVDALDSPEKSRLVPGPRFTCAVGEVSPLCSNGISLIRSPVGGAASTLDGGSLVTPIVSLEPGGICSLPEFRSTPICGVLYAELGPLRRLYGGPWPPNADGVRDCAWTGWCGFAQGVCSINSFCARRSEVGADGGAAGRGVTSGLSG